MPKTKLPNPKDFTITDEEFNGYVRTHQKFALDMLEDGRESIMPHLLVVTKNPENMNGELVLCAFAADFNEAEQKQGMMFGMGVKFYDDKKIVQAIVLASECWTAMRNKDSDWQDVQPRHDPHRQEGILVAGAGLNPKQRMLTTTPIRRDEKNNIVVDGEPFVAQGEDGRFFILDHFWRGYFSKVKRP